MDATIYFNPDTSPIMAIAEPEQVVAIVALAAAIQQKEQDRQA